MARILIVLFVVADVVIAMPRCSAALLARIHAATDVPATARRWRIDTDSLAREPLRAVGRWLPARRARASIVVARAQRQSRSPVGLQ